MMQKSNQSNFFIIEGDELRINPIVLAIPEFLIIHNADRSTDKKKSLKEFKYIRFIADYKSEYNSYGLSKPSQLGFDIFGDNNYKPRPDIQKAIDKYKELQNTHSMQYLLAIRNRVDMIIHFLTNAKLDEGTEEGKYKNPFISIDKVTKVLNELEDVMEKLEKWEKKVLEEEEDMQIRGGGELNAFENPENAEWLKRK